MIIKALCDYYDRKAALPDSGIAPPGWEWKEVPFVLVINQDGKLVQIDDTREGEGKKKRGKRYLVPQGKKRSNDVSPNLLCDVASYIFGVCGIDETDEKKKKRKEERYKEQRDAFQKRHQLVLGGIPEAEPLLRFLSSFNVTDVQSDANWPEISRTNPNITFRYAGDLRMVAEMPSISRVVNELFTANDGPVGICMVTGLNGPISLLHTSIKGIRNAQPSGASLVSFEDAAYHSYGKSQGLVAPTGALTVFKYTTALNFLLSAQSGRSITMADTSLVFWSFDDTTFEDEFASILFEPFKDDPDSGTEVLNRLLSAPRTGWYREEEDNRQFCYLALSPNSARISVREWTVGSVGAFSARIRCFFHEMSIVKPSYEPTYYRINRILEAVYCREDRMLLKPRDRDKAVPSNMDAQLLHVALAGGPYPLPFVKTALRRLHSPKKDRDIPCLVAVVKAWLNRHLSLNPNPNLKEMSMELDTSQPSVGYQLGRLFAVLEKIQECASKGSLNSTIREKFYGAACTTPVAVFATLLRLKNHHLAKEPSKGKVVYFERLLGEIMSHVSDFPAHLDLQEQGRFAIGYYHQRQAFFAGKTVEPESDETQD